MPEPEQVRPKEQWEEQDGAWRKERTAKERGEHAFPGLLRGLPEGDEQDIDPREDKTGKVGPAVSGCKVQKRLIPRSKQAVEIAGRKRRPGHR